MMVADTQCLLYRSNHIRSNVSPKSRSELFFIWRMNNYDCLRLKWKRIDMPISMSLRHRNWNSLLCVREREREHMHGCGFGECSKCTFTWYLCCGCRPRNLFDITFTQNPLCQWNCQHTRAVSPFENWIHILLLRLYYHRIQWLWFLDEFESSETTKCNSMWNVNREKKRKKLEPI